MIQSRKLFVKSLRDILICWNMKKKIALCSIYLYSFCTLLSCTINQPYAQFDDYEKKRNDPRRLTDSSLYMKIIGRDAGFLEELPENTIIHIASSTCPPCLKKAIALDSLSRAYGIQAAHLFVDDWAMNQNIYNFITKKTELDTVYVLDHQAFDQTFRNKERLLEVQDLLCKGCDFMSYYFIGWIKEGQFQLIQTTAETQQVFTALIPRFNQRVWKQDILDLFAVKTRILDRNTP